MATELNILLNAVDKASGPIDRVSGSVSSLDKSAKSANSRMQGLKSVLGTGLKIAGGLAAAGIGAVGFAMRDSIGLAREQINVEKQLDAVLKSTGGAAGLTAEEIKNMASELQGVTNFGDEATLAGQNMLLTFTNIGKDVFPAATETMLNMSQAMGQDIKSSAIQLGKALNNPVEGISALSRVGIQFTDQQKEQIKAMQEAGDVAGAQAIILAELETQFGGSARAMADPAIQLKNAFGDFKEEVGNALIPILNDLAQKALPLVQAAIEKLPEVIEWFEEVAVPVFNNIKDVIINEGIPAFNSIKDAIVTVIDFLKPIFASFGSAMEAGSTDKFTYLKDWLDENMPKIQQIVETVVGALTQFWTDHGDKVVELVGTLLSGIQNTFDTVLKVILGIVEFWLSVLTGDWEGAKDALIGIVDDIWEGIKTAFNLGVDAIKIIFSDFSWESIGEGIMTGIKTGIENGIQWIKDAASNAARSALNAAKSALGIGSPSKVMADEVGKPMAQGMSVGIDKELSALQRGISGGLGGFTSGLGSLAASSSMQPVAAGASYNINVSLSGGSYSDGRTIGGGIADEMRARGLR